MHDLNGLMSDFNKEKKMFNEINVVVLMGGDRGRS